MKLVIISDTHNRHRELDLPDGDVLIHCGDFSMLGQSAEVIDFLNWFSQKPHKNKILVAGNHDRLLDKNPVLAKSYMMASTQAPGTAFHYLEDSGVEINGVSFWGSPWTPKFGGWSFMHQRGSSEMQDVVKKIPSSIDVLITHGPPRGVLDLSPYGNESAGCDDLMGEIITRIRPKVHCFGHIHAGYGEVKHGHIYQTSGSPMVTKGITHFVNAAICNEEYEPINPPMEIEV